MFLIHFIRFLYQQNLNYLRNYVHVSYHEEVLSILLYITPTVCLTYYNSINCYVNRIFYKVLLYINSPASADLCLLMPPCCRVQIHGIKFTFLKTDKLLFTVIINVNLY